jgi:Fe-S oxidoreductase
MAGVSFTVMADEPCCGLYKADYMGKAEEARQDMVKAAEKINAIGARTIVPVCPSCTKAFLHDYRHAGIALQAQIVSFTSFLADLITEGRLQPKRQERLVTYQDPCRLARDLDETQAARTIIRACAELKDMHLHGKDTVCCGGGTLALYRPDITDKTARKRWDSARSTGASALVTACPTCYEIMGKVPAGMDLVSLDELLLDCLT